MAGAVGGTAELPEVTGEAANAPESSGLGPWLEAGITTAVLLAALTLALGAGAWHARRLA